ncbi:MAG TPA: hypothetical protein VIV57_26315 [Anaeromyxobacter sp.]
MPRTARTSILLVALAALACNTAAAARRAELRRGLDQARLSRSPAEIWPELQRFLHERGFPLVGEDRVAIGLKSQGTLGKLFSPGFETRVRGDGSRILETNVDEASESRVRAEALALPGGGTRLRVTMLKRSPVNHTEYSEWRDPDLELALLERLDPVAAAAITGKQPPPEAVAAAAAKDAWEPLRPLLGSWVGKLPGGAAVRWTFDFAAAGRFVEIHGTPLLFAGPTARAGGAEEMGRISPVAGAEGLVWHHFTNSGRVDRWRSEAAGPDGLVFLAESPESLPAGSRARLTLRPSGEGRMTAVLELAEPGKDLAVAGEVPLERGK